MYFILNVKPSHMYQINLFFRGVFMTAVDMSSRTKSRSNFHQVWGGWADGGGVTLVHKDGVTSVLVR